MSQIDDRIARLESRVKTLGGACLLLASLLSVMLLCAWRQTQDVVRARGFVVVDAEGRDRILIGSPVPESKLRKSALRNSAIVLVDEDGADRLALGESVSYLSDGKPVRRERAYSLLIYDKKGDERGGMGTFDMGKAVVVLDRARPDSDGVALLVDEQSDFVGLTANHRQRDGQYVQAIAFGVQRGSIFFNLDDPMGRRRVSMMLPSSGDPTCLLLPAGEGERRDVFANR